MTTAAIERPHTDELVADGLATVAEACRFLSLGRSSVYQLMDAGRLAYCKIGKARRIPWRGLRQLANDSLLGGESQSCS